jgi:hypothetical protein
VNTDSKVATDRAAKVRAWLRVAFQVGLAVIIVGLQVALLLIGSVQQRTMDGLAQASSGKAVSFNEALYVLTLNRQQIARHQATAQQQASLQSELIAVQTDVASTSTQSMLTGREIVALARAVPASLGCGLKHSDTPNVDELIDLGRQIRECLAKRPEANQGSAIIAVENLVKDLKAERTRQAENQSRINSITMRSEQLDKAELAGDLKAGDLDFAKLTSVFSEVDAMQASLGPIIGIAASLPPFSVQLLLAISSGLFGALLVTVILIVYPNNNLNLSRGSGVSARIALGGLVAVCVYMVLTAGSSLIGGGFAGLDTGRINVMGFSFVCVLAGAFSDKVAGWLSRNAEKLFDANPAPVARAGEGDPSVPG